MSSFHQVLIGGYPSGGLMTDQKPMLLPDEAFSNLQNAYVWRKRTKKREGTVGLGRLQLIISPAVISPVPVSGAQFNIYTVLSITPTTYAEIAPFSTTITLDSVSIADLGNGKMAQSGIITGATNANPCKITSTAHHVSTGDMVIINGVGGMTQLNGNTYTVTVVDSNHFTIGVNSTAYGTYTSGGTWTSLSKTGVINYITGNITLTFNTSPAASTGTFGYYPALQVMGITKQDVAGIGVDNTIFFDTQNAYEYISGSFQQLPSSSPTNWTGPNNPNGTNTFFFWTCNYQGANPSVRYFFATNNNITLGAATPYDPIYYYNNSTWTALQPYVTSTIAIFQSLIVIPYYGRLLMLNTWEGTQGSGPAGATNFFARCRFSKIGDPTAANSWRSDMFGLGGFLDAPTNESIVSVAFFRNVLIVFFEYSTWQLRYIGEYGLPFIFERISSDFGAVSTFGSIVFDQGVMSISDRGIIQTSTGGVKRLDEQIPETIFGFQIQNNAPDFVHGIRDFEKEVVYWNYVDVTSREQTQNFPTTALLFNYQNNTWAQFRDTISCFGTAQFLLGITWDSLTTLWESEVSWDNVDDQQYSDYVTAGNQQGFIFIYENQDAAADIPSVTMFSPSLAIYAVAFSSNPTSFTVANHNLSNGEIIYITGALWSGSDPGINNAIYTVYVVDVNTITLGKWNGENYDAQYFSSSTYIGGGLISLLPKMNIVGKDFNPFQGSGKQFKLSYIDFQMDSNQSFPSIPAVTVQLFVNSYLQQQANLAISNQGSSISNQELSNTSQTVGIIKFVQTGIGNPRANPCTVTSPNHSLQNGDMIAIANVLGTTQINNANYIISVVDANTFTLNGIDSTGWSTYVSGGIWNTSATSGQTYLPGTEYAWYRFYSTQFGQYIRVGITYDDTLMNQISTHQVPVELNSMNFWFREGGRLVN